MAKKLTFSQQKVNFLAITFQSVNRLISNFEYGKIWRIHGLFAKAVCWNKVVILGEKWLTWAIIYCRLCGQPIDEKNHEVPLANVNRVKKFWNRFNCAPARWALEKERRREGECLTLPLNLFKKQRPYLPLPMVCRTPIIQNSTPERSRSVGSWPYTLRQWHHCYVMQDQQLWMTSNASKAYKGWVAAYLMGEDQIISTFV